MAGILEDAEARATQWFQEEGDRIALIGPEAVSLGGSEYLWTLHRRLAGRLAPLDLDARAPRPGGLPRRHRGAPPALRARLRRGRARGGAGRVLRERAGAARGRRGAARGRATASTRRCSARGRPAWWPRCPRPRCARSRRCWASSRCPGAGSAGLEASGSSSGEARRPPRPRRSTSQWTGWTMSGGAGLRDEWIETPELNDDKFHDECGLFGVWNHAEAANLAYLGLYSLQHRGQESAGHRVHRRPELPRREGHGLGRGRLQPRPPQAPARPSRHRPRALLDGGQLEPPQRPAHQRADRARHGGAGPQRQPRQRRGPPSQPRAGRRGVPVHVGHRGDHPPPRPRRGRHPRGPASAGALPGEGGLHPAAPHPQLHGGPARSLRLPPALAGPPGRRVDPRLRDLRARPPGGGVRARHRARRDGRDRRSRA